MRVSSIFYMWVQVCYMCIDWIDYKRANRPPVLLILIHSRVLVGVFPNFIFQLFFHLPYSRWASSHLACGHEGSSHLSPVHTLRIFIAMQVQHSYNSSTNSWILLTVSTPVLTLFATEERKNTNPTLVRIELMTFALPGVQVTY